MIKRIFRVIKRFIFAILIIYGIDVILTSVGFYIPLNIITIGTVTILGIPGLLSLVAMFLIIM